MGSRTGWSLVSWSGAWILECGVWSLQSGVWSLESGIWSLESGSTKGMSDGLTASREICMWGLFHWPGAAIPGCRTRMPGKEHQAGKNRVPRTEKRRGRGCGRGRAGSIPRETLTVPKCCTGQDPVRYSGRPLQVHHRTV